MESVRAFFRVAPPPMGPGAAFIVGPSMGLVTIAGLGSALLGGEAWAQPVSPAIDAEGDAVRALNRGGILVDLKSVSVERDAHSINAILSFYTGIAPASAGVNASLTGYLELDLDNSRSTGTAPILNDFAAFEPALLGIDARIDLFSERNTPGRVTVTRVGIGQFSVPVVYSPYAVRFSIPLSMLGPSVSEHIAFTSIVGTTFQPTDAQDAIAMASLLPSPGAASAIAVAAGWGAGRRRRPTHEDASNEPADAPPGD